MILLLLLLTTCHVVQAEFQSCPTNEPACLYHARCLDVPVQQITTTNPRDFEHWYSASCKTGPVSKTELFIRPVLTNRWFIELHSTHTNTGISFGDSLMIMANDTEATLKIDSDAPIKIPVEQKGTVISLMVEAPRKLYKIFQELEIVYVDGDHATKSLKMEKFWEKVAELTPCNASLIIDDCSGWADKSCKALSATPQSVVCPEETLLWLKTDNSTWLALDIIYCDNATDWHTYAADGASLPEPKEVMELRCAFDEPEPWTASLSQRAPNQPNVDGKANFEWKAKEEGSKLIDSPITWVAIGLGGIIALAAVALVIVYAFRKLGKKPAAGKSGSNVRFHEIPQDPACIQTGASNSNSEADATKADKPLPTPAPAAPTHLQQTL